MKIHGRIPRPVLMPILMFLLVLFPRDPGSAGSGSPAFYLATDRSFSPEEQPYINLEGPGKAIEFRIYRIEDPFSYLTRRVEDRLVLEEPARPFANPFLLLQGAWERFTNDFRDIARLEFNRTGRTHLRRAAGVPDARVRSVFSPAARALLPDFPLLTSFVTPSTGESWSYRRIPIPLPEKGFFLIEAVQGDHTAHTLLNRSSLVSLTRQGDSVTGVSVADRITGEPVDGARIRLVDRDTGKLLQEGQTDDSGEALLPGRTPVRSLVFVEKGEDRAVSDPGFYSSSFYGSGGVRTYLYTDRPVYRPGETVHFKGFVRDYSDGVYRPLRGSGKVRLITAGGEEAGPELPVDLSSDTGSFSGEITLKKEKRGPTGLHHLVFSMGDRSYSSDFFVESYRLPPFRLTVEPDASGNFPGREIQFTAKASFFRGGPVAGEEIQMTVFRRPLYHESPVGRLTFDRASDYLGLEGKSQIREPVFEKKGILNSRGVWSVKLPVKDLPEDYVYSAVAVVRSGGVTLTATGETPVHRAPYFIRLNRSSRIFESGKEIQTAFDLIPFQTAQKTPSPDTIQGRPIELKVFEKSYHGISREKDRRMVLEKELRTDENGHAETVFQIEKPGLYTMEILSGTPDGSETGNTADFWVSGKAASVDTTAKDIPGRLILKSDRDIYRPGDVAEILITGPVSNGTIFLSLEGRTLHRQESISMKGNSLLHKIRIDSGLTPDFTVQAVQFSGGRTYRGEIKISAPPVDRFLNVKVEVGKKRYAPGETAEIRLLTETSSGAGVPADLSVAVVDEAVYSVRRDSTPDPGLFYYHPTRNNIVTTLSTEYRYFGYSRERRLQLARNDMDVLAGLKGESPEVREFLPQTAYWNPSIRTDSRGQAVIHFSLPDTPTTWRVVVRAVTGDTRAGEKTVRFQSWKELEVRSLVPPYLYRGSPGMVGLSVRNRTDEPRVITLRAEARGVNFPEGQEKKVKIGAGREEAVYFPVQFPPDAKIGSIPVLLEASADGFTDRLRTGVDLRSFAMERFEYRGFHLGEKEESADLDLKLPEGFKDLAFHIYFSPGGAIFLREALSYLADYPYGCVEQTMSRFLPLLALRQTSLGDRELMGRLPEMMKAGLEHLQELQNADGSFGWFGERGAGDPMMSAYVHRGLALARSLGAPVEDQSLVRLRHSLYRSLTAAKLDPDQKAYILFSLGEGGPVEESLLDSLVARRKAMNPFGLAMTSLALERSGDPSKAKIFFQDALEKLKISDSPRRWSQPVSYRESWDSDRMEATAALLTVASRLKEPERIQKRLIARILFNRKGDGWRNTRETASVILALAEAVSRESRQQEAVRVNLKWEGDSIGSFAYDPRGNPSGVRNFSMPRVSRSGTLQILREGEIPLTGSLAFRYDLEARHFPPSEGSVRVKRSYSKLTVQSDRDGKLAFQESQKNNFEAGDLILVQIQFQDTEAPGNYWMIEDPIPSGFAVEREDEEFYGPDRAVEYVSRSIYEDRAVFFIRGPAEKGTIRYFLRARTPGISKSLPAKASLMYYPERAGTSADAELKVVEVSP